MSQPPSSDLPACEELPQDAPATSLMDLDDPLLLRIMDLAGSKCLRCCRLNRRLQAAAVHIALSHPDDPWMLHQVCCLGLMQVVKELLGAGADPNMAPPVKKKNAAAQMPLRMAAKHGHAAVVRILLRAGALVNGGDPKFRPVTVAANCGHADVVGVLATAGADGLSEAMQHAATRSHTAVIQVLLQHSVDVNSKSPTCRTALHAAAVRGSAETVKLLLDSGAAISYDGYRIPSVDSGFTPIALACRKGNVGAVRCLLDAGCSAAEGAGSQVGLLFQAAKSGHSKVVELLLQAANAAGLDCASLCTPSNCKYLPLLGAVYEGHMDIVQLLLETGAAINACSLKEATALHCAAQTGRAECLSFLLSMGADVHKTTAQGSTALHAAAHAGHVSTMEPLLAAGAELEAADSDGNTALHKAARSGHLAAVAALLNAGANIEAKAECGYTALHAAATSGNAELVQLLLGLSSEAAASKAEGDVTPLHVAGSAEVVHQLLAAGASVDAPTAAGQTSLLTACGHGRVSVVSALLQSGANLHHIAQGGPRTALAAAAAGGHAAVVEVLLDKGMDVDFTPPDTDGQGRAHTSLHTAAEFGHAPVAKLLIDGGADVDAVDSRGYRSLHFAAEGGHGQICEWLLDAGAEIDALNDAGVNALGLSFLASLNDQDDARRVLLDWLGLGEEEEEDWDDGDTDEEDGEYAVAQVMALAQAMGLLLRPGVLLVGSLPPEHQGGGVDGGDGDEE